MNPHRGPDDVLGYAVAAMLDAGYEDKSAVDTIPICSYKFHVAKIP